MRLPLTKTAGPIDGAIKVLNHPATAAASTALTLAPMVSDLMKPKEPEPVQRRQKIGRLFPEVKTSFAFLAPIAARVGAFLAKPAVSGAMNAAGAASTVKSLMPSKGPQGQQAPGMHPPSGAGTSEPSGAFTQPMTRLASVISIETGTVDMSQPVAQAMPVPSTRGNPAMGSERDGNSQGANPTTSAGASQPKKPSISAGAPKAFKVGGLFDAPKFDRALNLASQAAVIGSTAIPFYQLYQEHKRMKEDAAMDPAVELRAVQNAQQNNGFDPRRKVAAMLPLQPKRPLMDRIGDGVKDFGEGAYDALDHEAGKLLTPSTQLDPMTHRIPSLSHAI